MKERPILFSGPMARAILEGRKTMTRRVVKPQPSEWWTPYSYSEVHKMRDDEFVMRNDMPVVIGWGPSNEDGSEAHKCPYGVPGDRLWVRETFFVELPLDQAFEVEGLPLSHWKPRQIEEALYHYRATPDVRNPDDWGWRPSIHMPRWASRLTLEIVSVRVERLQDISEADALAEGCPVDELPNGAGEGGTWHCPTAWYRELWESINGPGSWDANPWVWVVEFKVVQP